MLHSINWMREARANAIHTCTSVCTPYLCRWFASTTPTLYAYYTMHKKVYVYRRTHTCTRLHRWMYTHMEATAFWQNESIHLDMLRLPPQHIDARTRTHTHLHTSMKHKYIHYGRIRQFHMSAPEMRIYVKCKMIYELGLVSEGIYINCTGVPFGMEIKVPIFGVHVCGIGWTAM